jgi:B12 binding domain/Radical SAM superfamily
LRPPRILLCSVFGPYATDDEYGSRRLNPMELYHNQVTKTQGPFSLRMFHRSWGLMLIQANLEAPCTLLDFPDLDRFIAEIRDHDYDIVGISSIIPNVLKVRKMCELVRRYLPHAKIVVGGHVANLPDLRERIDADHCVRGEGVGWFRRYLGEDETRPIRHPVTLSANGVRCAGADASEKPGEVAATLIPTVGCPLGCNFCSTSAMFGGKGKFVEFYSSGDQLFEIMCQLERELGVRSFFVMDENFLIHRKRALRLLELMEQNDKAWALYVFSSANVLCKYTLDQLVRLGVSWVWLGIEGRDSEYAKLNGIDTSSLVRELQSHGICVLGSTIIGLEEHGPDNIDQAIEHAVRHDTDFHQFMLYTPVPGTPLHRDMSARGLMKPESEMELADIHGQLTFNYRHPRIDDRQATAFLTRAFERDFALNGPSTVRIARTRLLGWKRHKNHPDARVRRRQKWEARELATTYSALTGAARLYFRDEPALRAKLSRLASELRAELGLTSWLAGAIGGRWLLGKIRREQRGLEAGASREPPTFYERNAACSDNPEATLCRYVEANSADYLQAGLDAQSGSAQSVSPSKSLSTPSLQAASIGMP